VFVEGLRLDAMQLASSRDVVVENEDMDVDAQREYESGCGTIRR
jgi:hypothetical protein